MIEVGLIDEDKKTGLFKLSSLGKKALMIIKQKKTSIAELFSELIQEV